MRNMVSPERLLQLERLLVEGGSADRVEPAVGSSRNSRVRIERQRASQAGTLAHAARQLGGYLGPALAGRPVIRIL